MAPQLLKPHQAIAVLLKIKSRCVGGGGGGKEGKKAKTGERWLRLNSFLSFMHFLYFKKTGTRALLGTAHVTVASARPPRHFNLNSAGRRGGGGWVREGDGRKKEFIIWLTFLNSEKTNHATQVLDRGPKPQEKI